MGGEACFESAGQWWWFPTLVLSVLVALVCVVVLVSLWTGVTPGEPVEEVDPSSPWGRVRSRLAWVIPPVLAVLILVRVVRDEGWPAAGELVSGVTLLGLGLAGLGAASVPMLRVVDLRFDAMSENEALNEADTRRVGRARWATAAGLLLSALTFVVLLGMYGGTMREVACPA